MSACECSPCGQRFSSVTTFDAHQDVDYSRQPAVICRDPASAGLERNRFGRWTSPASPEDKARLKALKARRVA